MRLDPSIVFLLMSASQALTIPESRIDGSSLLESPSGLELNPAPMTVQQARCKNVRPGHFE